MREIIIKIKNVITNITSKVGDKNMHLICSFLITFIIGLFNVLAGVLVGCIVGLAKEIYDLFRYKKYGEGVGFNNSDLAYDSLGIVIAIIILVLL